MYSFTKVMLQKIKTRSREGMGAAILMMSIKKRKKYSKNLNFFGTQDARVRYVRADFCGEGTSRSSWKTDKIRSQKAPFPKVLSANFFFLCH